MNPAGGEGVEGPFERPFSISTPYDTGFYQLVNGRHPLIKSLLPTPSWCRQVPSQPPNASGRLATLADAARFLRRLGDGQHLSNGRVTIGPKERANFVAWRGVNHIASFADGVDLHVLHTIPFSFDGGPWLLHIENVTTLFWPFLRHGEVKGVVLRDQPIFWMVRELLRSPRCLGIVTHLYTTVQAIMGIFACPEIDAKIFYVSPGLRLDPRDAAIFAKAAERKREPRSDLVCLFTNSWSGDGKNFFLRGGVNVVHGFLGAYQRDQSLRLRLRCKIPRLDPALHGFDEADLRGHPAIEVIDRFLDDREMCDLMGEADVYLLPAAGFHSASIMQALHAGAIPVIADTPDYDELLLPDVTACQIRDLSALVFDQDPESSWLRDDYTLMYGRLDHIASAIADTLLMLRGDQDLRRRLSQSGFEDAQHRFRIEASAGAMGAVIEAAVERAHALAGPDMALAREAARGAVEADIAWYRDHVGAPDTPGLPE